MLFRSNRLGKISLLIFSSCIFVVLLKAVIVFTVHCKKIRYCVDTYFHSSGYKLCKCTLKGTTVVFRSNRVPEICFAQGQVFQVVQPAKGYLMLNVKYESRYRRGLLSILCVHFPVSVHILGKITDMDER